MNIGSADLAAAIRVVWVASGLDDKFKSLWPQGKVGGYPVLHDGVAGPGQPWPYCVYRAGTPHTTTKMSGLPGRGSVIRGPNARQEIQTSVYTFSVYARPVAGDSRSQKEIAADLAASIIAVYGGHPSIAPQQLKLDNGGVLQVEKMSDFGIQAGDDNYVWSVNFKIDCDIPVAA